MTTYDNKRKIVNDPVYGFINIPNTLVYDVISHPYFQRLRRIKQLGLSHLVYPGALHTRFGHALGAMYLMGQAIDVLRQKGHHISAEEENAATMAILLHDIGHGPFSHSLEHVITTNLSHENLSLLFMKRLNQEMKGKLDLAIEIFEGHYHKKFLHQLVSGQLDVDRLDYLTRDSFFTGVSEGIIGTERIIKMLNIHENELVVDEKGIYSIEKFIISRRLMYWQVYLHKTVIAAEQLLIKSLQRAKELYCSNVQIFIPDALQNFFKQDYAAKDFETSESLLDSFAILDDNDIMYSLKVWMRHPDKTLSFLAGNLINRELPKVEIQKEAFSEEQIETIRLKVKEHYHLTDEELKYFVFTDKVQNNAYSFLNDDKINILYKNGQCLEISQASDQLDKHFLEKLVVKHFICYPKC